MLDFELEDQSDSVHTKYLCTVELVLGSSSRRIGQLLVVMTKMPVREWVEMLVMKARYDAP